MQLPWDHHQHQIWSATALSSWVLKASKNGDSTIWSVLQLAGWKKACQKSLSTLSFWLLTWAKSTTGSLLLAKSPPSCNLPVISQFKYKISLDNPCWKELLLAGDSKRSLFKTARHLLPLGLEKPGQNDKRSVLQSFVTILIFFLPASMSSFCMSKPVLVAPGEHRRWHFLPAKSSHCSLMPSLAVGYRLPPVSWGLMADGSKPQSLVLDSVLELNILSSS